MHNLISEYLALLFHWLVHQAWLTYVEIKKEVTIPHIVTGLIVYTIIHTIVSINRKLSSELLRSRRMAIKIHHREKHVDKLKHCATGTCATLAAVHDI